MPTEMLNPCHATNGRLSRALNGLILAYIVEPIPISLALNVQANAWPTTRPYHLHHVLHHVQPDFSEAHTDRYHATNLAGFIPIYWKLALSTSVHLHDLRYGGLCDSGIFYSRSPDLGR